jgi:hypothetical protein
MKKLLILSAIVLTGAVAANAQVPGVLDTSKTATIGVNVTDVKTIEIVSGEQATFTLANETDYNNAATATGIAPDVETQIKVVSRGGYKVKAALQGNLTTTATGEGRKNIPGTALGVRVNGTPTAASGETAATPNGTNRTFADGGSEITELVASPAATGGTRGTTFNVAYKISNFTDVVNLAVGSFTNTIVYTIEAN